MSRESHLLFILILLSVGLATTSYALEVADMKEATALSDTAVKSVSPLACGGPGQLTTAAKIITWTDAQDLYPERPGEIIKLQSGVRIERSGGLGFPAILNLRGGGGNGETLALSNGSRLNMTQRWDLLPVEMIDRIELMKGPVSAIYGAGAIGGAINIRTLRPVNEILETRISTFWGNYQRETYRVKGAQKKGRLAYSFSAHDSQVKSYRYYKNHEERTRFNSDYKSRGGGVNTWVEIVPDGYLGVSGSRYESERGLPGADIDGQESTYDDFREKLTTEFFSVSYEQSFGAKFSLQGKYFGDDSLKKVGEELNNDPPLTFNQLRGVSVKGSVADVFSLGVESYSERYNSEFKDKTIFSDTGYFIQKKIKYKDSLALTGSWRIDNHSKFGDQSSAKVNICLTPFNHTKISASTGSGYQLPAFDDLYGGYGDDELEPASGQMSDISLIQGVGDILTASVAYYTGETRNKIERLNNQVRNTDVRHSGLETLAEIKAFSVLSGKVSYINQTATYKNTGKTLVYQPAYYADYQVKFENNYFKDDLTLKMIYGTESVGSRNIDTENKKTLPAYNVANATLALRIITLEIFLKATNLYNENYETRK